MPEIKIIQKIWHIFVNYQRDWAVCMSLMRAEIKSRAATDRCQLPHMWHMNRFPSILDLISSSHTRCFTDIFFPLKISWIFHQTWWIRQKTRKLLPIWKNNFKWLIYIHIKTIRILIWIHFLLFIFHNNCNKCQAGFIIHQLFRRQIIHIPNK